MNKPDRLFFKQLRFRQLHALVEISRQKNFSAMAQALDLSVVSAWRQVRALEEQFGVELVTAKGSETELTEDGRMLTEMARPLVENFLSLPAVFADRQQDKARTRAPEDRASARGREKRSAGRVDNVNRGAAGAGIAFAGKHQPLIGGCDLRAPACAAR